jgi:hypothetical protein
LNIVNTAAKMPMEEPMAQMPPPTFVEGAARNDGVATLYDDNKEKQPYDEEEGKVVAANEYYDPKSEFTGLASIMQVLTFPQTLPMYTPRQRKPRHCLESPTRFPSRVTWSLSSNWVNDSPTTEPLSFSPTSFNDLFPLDRELERLALMVNPELSAWDRK